jgi:hypothetical protein
MNYQEFIERKTIRLQDCGLENVPTLNSSLFDFQEHIVSRSLRKGRYAIFCDCGLGKTPMQLEWADKVPGRVLILAPLAVAQQTVREGVKFGIDVTYQRTDAKKSAKIVITNYEMLENFSASDFDGVVLDESSILKSYSGMMRNLIISTFGGSDFRLACTATPAPNDFMELGNHSEFLGALTRTEMLSTFFVHDGGDTSKWRLKRHAKPDFWKWVCSWAVMARKPSDLGFSDERFKLPELRIHDIAVSVDKPLDGRLFSLPAITLEERRRARRESISERVDVAERIIRDSWTKKKSANTTEPIKCQTGTEFLSDARPGTRRTRNVNGNAP